MARRLAGRRRRGPASGDAPAARRTGDVLRGRRRSSGVSPHRQPDPQVHRRQRRHRLLRRAGEPRSHLPCSRQHGRRRVRLADGRGRRARRPLRHQRRPAPSTTPSSTSTPTAPSRSSSAARRGRANWLALPADAARITTRHYYEDVQPRAAEYDAVHPAPHRGAGRRAAADRRTATPRSRPGFAA